MKFTAILLALLLVAAPAARDSGAHPIGKVIKLLKELWLQVEKEGEEEQATWMKFSKWCSDNIETLDAAVQSDKDDIETLSDTVASKEKEQASLEENIQHLTDEIAKYEAEESNAKSDRDDANKVYEANDKDFATTIKAVEDAIKALKDSKAGALLQFLKPESPSQEHALRQLIQQPLVLEQLSDEQREALSAAVFGDGAKPVTEADIIAKEKYAKAGNTYTFKSGNVIDLLESLKTHFNNEKTASTKAETAAANEYAVAKDSRKAAIDAAKSAKDDRTKDLGDVKKDLNTARGDLQDEKDELKADSKTLEDTHDTCNTKAREFKERTGLRKGEMEAIKAAQGILEQVSGVRHETPENEKGPALKAAAVLLQVDDPKMKAVNLLRQEAALEHSKQLSRFADQLAARLDGPFDSINNMVQKMIFRLMDEQKQEDEHKHWCDMEIENSEVSKKDKENREKTLDAKIKDSKAHIDELTIKIKDLDAKVVKLTKFMSDATEVRKESKKQNELAIKDSEAAQAAIAKASAVLETYYKDSGMIEKKPWEFLQEPNPVKLPKEPSSWGASYTGVTDPTQADSGVLAVLKATAADFSKMEADTRANEIADQEQFDKDMKDAAIEKAKSSKESEMKGDEKKRTLADVSSMEKQRKHNAGELGAVNQYLKDLEKPCMDGDSKYEDRKAARSEEIKALQKAQTILEDAFKEDKFIQIHKQ